LKIGQQLMKYQATFNEGQYVTKTILQQEIKRNEIVHGALEKLLGKTSFPNVSELLDEVIFQKE